MIDRKLRIGSLFAGVGGFDLGFQRAGFETAWAVEIDEKAQSVLRLRFPHADLHDDVTKVGAHNLAPVDVITYGFPCQDLSVAGKRAGLDGARSGLFHEAVRVIRELRARDGKPDIAIAENVPGLFSSNGGRDFAVVLQTLVDVGARDVAWRVLDSQHFAVAQRRKRVFIVSDFGGERAAEILSLAEGVRGDSAKGSKARKGSARGTGPSSESGGRVDGTGGGGD
jgi:DNA (cytosine-5)-methyltransferase 1